MKRTFTLGFVAACALVRVLSLAVGHVHVPLDAWSFRAVAAALEGRDFGAYNGARPPMFPLRRGVADWDVESPGSPVRNNAKRSQNTCCEIGKNCGRDQRYR
jgi:hypothetical protein